MTPEQLANKWIKQMQDFGLTPDEMLNVIALAKRKIQYLNIQKT